MIFSLGLTVFTKRLPKPPGEGFQTLRDYMDWENRYTDELGRASVKPLVLLMLLPVAISALMIPLVLILILVDRFF